MGISEGTHEDMAGEIDVTQTSRAAQNGSRRTDISTVIEQLLQLN